MARDVTLERVNQRRLELESETSGRLQSARNKLRRQDSKERLEDVQMVK